MENTIKETTRLLSQGILTKNEADKILLDLLDVSKYSCSCSSNTNKIKRSWKTAVEWLVSELVKNKFIQEEGAFTQPLIIKAKEMEKERVIDFAKKFSDFNGLTFNEKEVSKEYLEKLYDEYYKETFKSE